MQKTLKALLGVALRDLRVCNRLQRGLQLDAYHTCKLVHFSLHRVAEVMLHNFCNQMQKFMIYCTNHVTKFRTYEKFISCSKDK